jgi:hypothetical protein
MKKLFIIALLFPALGARAQYTREKIRDILTDKSEKTWSVTGINTERPEKAFTFRTDNSVTVEDLKGIKKPDKWKLHSTDDIRWFIDIGNVSYELIISYDKKGEQYVKLTHRADNRSSGYYEIRLTEAKK